MNAYLEAAAWKARWRLQETAQAAASKVNGILRNRSGAMSLEYALVATGVAIVCGAVMAGMKLTGTNLLTKAEAALNAVNP